MHRGEEVAGVLVVSGGDAPPVLEAAEHTPDDRFLQFDFVLDGSVSHSCLHRI